MPKRLVGTPAASKGALRNLTGSGTFVSDISFPDSLHCRFVRSVYAHARITGVNTERAARARGVVAVVTSKEMERFSTPLKIDLFPGDASVKPLHNEYLAREKTRFVGEPIVAVVATDEYAAADAAELVDVEYEPLGPVTDTGGAVKEGAPLLYEEWGSNVMYKMEQSFGDVEGAFQKAERVFGARFKSHRYMPCPMEGRGVVARYNPADGSFEFWSSTQHIHVERLLLSRALKSDEQRMRVIAPSVGGGFGMKLGFFAETVVAGVASIMTGRPVKWIEERTEHFLASCHAREIEHDIKFAMAKDGRILGVKDRVVGDIGVGTGYPHGHAVAVSAAVVPGAYKIPSYQFEVTGVVTNKCAFGAYRGFGMPEASFAVEVMLDRIAKELSLDPVELRLRNLVKDEDFPYTSPTGMIMEKGSYVECVRRASELIGYRDFSKLKEEARRKGRFLGLGLAFNVESTAANISKLTGIITGHDFVRLAIGRDGKLTVYSGVSQIGTDLETSLAQVAADSTGIDFADVVVKMGDTQSTPYSAGLWGSRAAAVCGPAVMLAGQRLREKVLRIASHLLEARYEDLNFEDGRIAVAGSPNRRISTSEVAEVAISSIQRLPKGMEPGLEVTTWFDPPLVRLTPDEKGRVNFCGATNNAAHACIVEVDVQTGTIKVVRYVIVHDVGNMINPAIVEGQIVGGAVQSLGGTIYEELVYDSEGQLLTSTLMDYYLPSAVEAPSIEVDHFVTPTPHIPGGFKGAGESGTVSAPACVTNAVIDALSPFGVWIDRTPLTPEKMWRLIKGAPNGGAAGEG